MASKYLLKIDQASDLDLTIGYRTKTSSGLVPIDVTGYSASLQIIDGQETTEISTANGKISVDGVSGNFIIAVPYSEVKTYDFSLETKFEFEITAPSGKKKRLLVGPVVLQREIISQ